MLIEPADINAYVSATDYIKKEGGRCITNIFLAYDELEKLVQTRPSHMYTSDRCCIPDSVS